MRDLVSRVILVGCRVAEMARVRRDVHDVILHDGHGDLLCHVVVMSC